MSPGADSEFTPETAGEGEGELDFQRIKEIAGLVLRAPRRHPLLAAVSFLLPLALGVAAAIYLPRAYTCSARILAQKNQVLPALGNPGRAVPRDADSPTKNAADTILQRDNIVALIKQLDLVDRWQSTRQPLLRLKDRLTAPLTGPRSDDDRLLDMVGLLEKRLVVAADDSSINIEVEWPDRQLSFEIVSFLQKNFLEARYDSNVNVITEAIRILEERAKPQAAEVDAALADLTRTENERRGAAPLAMAARVAGRPRGVGRPAATAPAAGADAVAGPAPGADDAEELEDVRRRIKLIKQDREAQVLQAQNQLADARATLGPLHPTVVALNEKIADLRGDPSGLAPLAARERDLVARIAKAMAAPAPAASVAGNANVASAPAGGTPAPPVTAAPANVAGDLRDDPQVALAVSKLQAVSSKYSELLSRIEAANIELDVSRAAFKYQYSVVRPAELPRAPTKPNVLVVFLAGLVAALALGLGIPGAIDLTRGRFIEAWQVQRSLDIPLLGDISPPRLP